MQYFTIVVGASFGIFGQFTFERLLQATGRTFQTMITQGLGAIINIVLDPIFIFGWFGLPAMGVAGAAIATVIGQIIACFLGLYINHKYNHDIQINMKNFRFDKHILRQIYTVSIPSIIMQSIGSIMTYGLNLILIGFSSTATAVFGIYFPGDRFWIKDGVCQCSDVGRFECCGGAFSDGACADGRAGAGINLRNRAAGIQCCDYVQYRRFGRRNGYHSDDFETAHEAEHRGGAVCRRFEYCFGLLPDF